MTRGSLTDVKTGLQIETAWSKDSTAVKIAFTYDRGRKITRCADKRIQLTIEEADALRRVLNSEIE